MRELLTSLSGREGGGRGRATATTTHRQQLPDHIITELASGNVGVVLTTRWRCQHRQCRNYTGTCYHPQGQDGPHNHIKLDSALLSMWGDAIRKGEATIDELPGSVAVRAIRAQEALRRTRQPHEPPLASATPFISPFWNLWTLPPPPGYCVAPPQSYSAFHAPPTAPAVVTPPHEPPSSPIRLEESPSQQLAGFFTWLESQPSFRSSNL
ncbi:hypothetical protein B0J12DRAFT_157476 [Macrophomina phaseolina]|uniref:FLYWCH-type domain-containing protein n=1 Tax=Macrophomina phaseolina TaxID=35725 RepID=A0ABQ8GUH8_9PEZI|nr:hypothetical protein B0J12DRAFT_157476 [Macrophomina phaseolina]